MAPNMPWCSRLFSVSLVHIIPMVLMVHQVFMARAYDASGAYRACGVYGTYRPSSAYDVFDAW